MTLAPHHFCAGVVTRDAPLFGSFHCPAAHSGSAGFGMTALALSGLPAQGIVDLLAVAKPGLGNQGANGRQLL